MDHGGERPYPCPECSFTCKTKQQLNEHRRKHSVSWNLPGFYIFAMAKRVKFRQAWSKRLDSNRKLLRFIREFDILFLYRIQYACSHLQELNLFWQECAGFFCRRTPTLLGFQLFFLCECPFVCKCSWKSAKKASSDCEKSRNCHLNLVEKHLDLRLNARPELTEEVRAFVQGAYARSQL